MVDETAVLTTTVVLTDREGSTEGIVMLTELLTRTELGTDSVAVEAGISITDGAVTKTVTTLVSRGTTSPAATTG